MAQDETHFQPKRIFGHSRRISEKMRTRLRNKSSEFGLFLRSISGEIRLTKKVKMAESKN